MGMRATAQRLIEIVQAVVPRTLEHIRFRCLDAMEGAAPNLETHPHSDDRLFEIALGKGADGGEVGTPPLLKRADGFVRVRYVIEGSSLARSVTQAEDAESIQKALHTPIDWQTPTTGLECVGAYEAPTTEPILSQDTDSPRHEVLAIPFFIFYREAT